MSMTVVVTRNVEDRVRGFLASCMLELAAGVYSSATMNVAVRERIFSVLEKWNVGGRADSAIMVWADRSSPSGQGVRILGEPPVELVRTSSVVLSRRPLSEEAVRSLTTEVDPVPF